MSVYLKEILNFTYIITPPDEGIFGFPSKNGSWSGMVGALQRQEIDLGKKFRTIFISDISLTPP